MLYVLAPINLAADCITRDDGSIEQDVQAIGQWSSIDIVCRYAVVFPPTLTFCGTHTLATWLTICESVQWSVAMLNIALLQQWALFADLCANSCAPLPQLSSKWCDGRGVCLCLCVSVFHLSMCVCVCTWHSSPSVAIWSCTYTSNS